MDHVQKREQTAGETDNGNDDPSYAVLRRNVVIALSTHSEHCVIGDLVSISHHQSVKPLHGCNSTHTVAGIVRRE